MKLTIEYEKKIPFCIDEYEIDEQLIIDTFGSKEMLELFFNNDVFNTPYIIKSMKKECNGLKGINLVRKFEEIKEKVFNKKNYHPYMWVKENSKFIRNESTYRFDDFKSINFDETIEESSNLNYHKSIGFKGYDKEGIKIGYED